MRGSPLDDTIDPRAVVSRCALRTARIVAYFQQVNARLGPPDARPAHPWREWVRTTTDAYLATLDTLGGRTGIMIAERQRTS